MIYHPETKAVISIGYNDTPFGEDDCSDGGCVPCQSDEPVRLKTDCNCVHAEMNAILLAARRGIKVEGCWIAVTYLACPSCLKHMKQAGIERIEPPAKDEGRWVDGSTHRAT